MIGVIADSAEHEIVREFFELFKTPWEFYREDRHYEVLLCASDVEFDKTARVVVLYASGKTQADKLRVQTGDRRADSCILRHAADPLPIYGYSLTFADAGTSLLVDDETEQCVAYLERSGDRILARVGYDLFREIGILLTAGQPEANAGIPALELHIAFLRDLITGCGIPLAEIPPIPEGHSFIACLTHDVDHPSLRRHRWDHTTLGFLYRAVFGSAFDFVRGRVQAREVLTNWVAALKLPLVQTGVAKDFWREFADRYLEIEQGLPSTYFVIPFEGRPGKRPDGPAPAFRAARYGVKDIADVTRRLAAAGCEIALHGIDAWIDDSHARQELVEVLQWTGNSEIGVRMHWLYYDCNSPAILESAGALYDSTVGYNRTVGYCAGTTQAYQPVGARRLLELPLHVMDTALFYPAHLGLSARQAKALLSRMLDDAARFGGCLTINWHDRSLAPERIWDACYRELVEELKRRGAWFATASEAVAWFRKRRAAGFETGTDLMEPGAVRAKVATVQDDRLPGLRLRIHKARESGVNRR